MNSTGRGSRAKDPDLSQTEKPEDFLDADEAVKEWLIQSGNFSEYFQVYLYEIAAGGRARIEKWDRVVPDVSEIAAKYGPGKYFFQVSTNHKGTFRRDFSISEKAGRHGGNNNLSTSGNGGMSVIGDVLSVVERMFANIVKPVMDQAMSSHSQQQAAAPALSGEVYSDFSRTMNTIVKENLKDTMNMRREILSMIPAAQIETEEEEDEEEPEISLIDRILPLIEQALPALIGDPKTAALVAPIVRAAPEFVALMKSPNEMHIAAAHVARKYGTEALVDIAGRLGIPDSIVQAVTAGNEGA